MNGWVAAAKLRILANLPGILRGYSYVVKSACPQSQIQRLPLRRPDTVRTQLPVLQVLQRLLDQGIDQLRLRGVDVHPEPYCHRSRYSGKTAQLFLCDQPQHSDECIWVRQIDALQHDL